MVHCSEKTNITKLKGDNLHLISDFLKELPYISLLFHMWCDPYFLCEKPDFFSNISYIMQPQLLSCTSMLAVVKYFSSGRHLDIANK